MMVKDPGRSLEASLVTDQGLKVSESLSKVLAVILRTALRSVPSGGFNNRWEIGALKNLI